MTLEIDICKYFYTNISFAKLIISKYSTHARHYANYTTYISKPIKISAFVMVLWLLKNEANEAIMRYYSRSQSLVSNRTWTGVQDHLTRQLGLLITSLYSQLLTTIMYVPQLFSIFTNNRTLHIIRISNSPNQDQGYFLTGRVHPWSYYSLVHLCN